MHSVRFLAALCCLPLLISPLSGEVMINEVLYDPEGADTDLEWVELINQGDSPVNLQDYLLDADGPNFMLPEYILTAGDLLVVHTNCSSDPYVEDGHMYLLNTDHNMGNSHGFVGLWRPNDFGQVADFFVSYVAYGEPGQTWESQAINAGIWYPDEFVPDVAAGHSIHWDGNGYGAAFWYDDAEPVPGSGESITEIQLGEGDGIIPQGSIVRLLPGYPNPFNDSTRIRFQLTRTAGVNLTVYSILGEVVRTPLRRTTFGPGLYSVDLEMGGLPAGTYFCRIAAGADVDLQALCYLK